MRRLLAVLLLLLAPAVLAQHASETTGATAAHGAESESHAVAHPEEPGHGAEHGEEDKTYFGIPGWILKLANMLLFLGILGYFVAGPVKKAFAERSEAIRKAAEEARERRVKADRMADEIQARLTAIEQEVRAIHERARAEGERQRAALIAAAEAEAQKILDSARNQVDTRLKHARVELTELAATLAADRAETILREKMTEQDQKKLFNDSLGEIGEVRS